MPRIIGLISGTSVDGIDAALVEVEGGQLDLRVQLVVGETYAYGSALRDRILAACSGAALSLAELASLDDDIAQVFAEAAIALQQLNLSQGGEAAGLIGSHGQTVFHRPRLGNRLAYSIQLGRGDAIAQLTGLPTVSNFRAADIAAGGEGAPLVPPIDAYLLGHPTEHRCIQNIGGIGNLTYLPPTTQPNWQTQVRGWDTGPGNTLIDIAVQRLSQGELTYDADGAWAAQGKPNVARVEQWLKHPYFRQAPPKSTGRELFGWDYFEPCFAEMQAQQLSDADILATLTEFTVCSIAQNYRDFLPALPDAVFVGGGGSRNHYLMARLAQQLPQTRLHTTDVLGINSDFKEAIAFAILAHWHQQALPGNLPSVTGALSPCILGQYYRRPVLA
ncbi:MAG: anhydro-N-acetylmuramic acid kinase [Synechococcales cyanobacterium CRU_2_2]|nr:anhydro-N-acetylmuramic acid kinase [Synechococcales cyanobacterium CRU_2_2]